MKKQHLKVSLIGGMLIAMSASVNAQWTENATSVYLTNGTKRVGIGTAAPSYPLDIKQAANCSFRIQSTTSGSSNLILSRSAAAGNNCLVNYKTGSTDLWYTGVAGTNNDFRIRNAAGIDNLFISQATGNVGIGTTTPATLLDVRGVNAAITVGTIGASLGSVWLGNSNHGLTRDSNNHVIMQTAGLGALIFRNGINPTEKMRITSNGNVGIGTTNPQTALDVNGQIQMSGGHFTFNSQNGIINYGPGGTLFFRTLSTQGNIATYTERMSLDASGNLYINGTSFAGAKFGVQADQVAISGKVNNNFSQAVTGIANGGANAYAIYGVSTAGYAGYFVGNVYTTGAYLPSDEKLKENIAPMQNALDKVMKLEVKTYNFKTAEFPQMNLPAMKQNGFIAQNLETVFPELIRNNEENNSIGQTAFKSVNYIGMIPVLTEAIQEQQKQLEAKDTKIAELENKLNNMQLCVESLCNASAAQKASSIEPQVLGNLFQNTPNPFNQTTVIRYALNSDNNNGKIIIRDLNGNLVKQINISNSGKGQVTINANELTAGTYTYTLEIAGASVDTKLMVVTK